MSPASVSVVVPVFRSEATLRPLVERLRSVLAGRSAPYEIVLVNDGSPDGSWALIEALARSDACVRGIHLMRNFGQHNALLCGIRAARHEVIVTLDADLQHPPEEIPRLLDALAQGYDVMYGVPASGRHSLFRRLASHGVRFVVRRAFGVANASQISAFRAFRATLCESFAAYRSPSVFIDVLLTWSTTRLGAVSVRHDARGDGRSSYSLAWLLGHFLNILTSFSTLPLRMASWIGFGFTLFGMGVLAYVLIVYMLFGYSIPGFPFLASIIAIFSGAQMAALGIIGEYLARVHFRLMGKPPYAVRETVGIPAPDGAGAAGRFPAPGAG